MLRVGESIMSFIDKSVTNKKNIILSFYFAIYFFAFMMIESEVNSKIAMFDTNKVTIIYAFGLLATGGGYLTFPFLRNLIQGKRSRQIGMTIIGLFACITAILMVFSTEYKMTIACAMISLLLMGHIGAFIHYVYAFSYRESNNLGENIGIIFAIAIVFQFVFQNIGFNTVAFIIAMCVVGLYFIYMGLRPDAIWIVEDPLPSSARKSNKRELIIIVLSVICMSIILSFNDNFMVSKDVNGEVSLFAWVRLFYAVGLICAGFVADYKEGKYLSTVTAIVIMLSTIAAVFLATPSGYNINMSIMYFYSGFYVMFFTIKGMRYAIESNRPMLWAGIGRIVRSVTTAVMTLVFVYVDVNFVGIVVVTSIFTIINVVLCLILDKNYDVKTKNDVRSEGLLEDDIYKISEKYLLTEKEKEVLILLLTTEDTNQEMADKLFISRRVLQRHIASIYEKTDTKSRIGLYQLFLRTL